MASDVVTNKDLYTAMKDLRSEITTGRTETQGAIQRLDDKFMNMESGRLARLEERINHLQLKDATLSLKVYILVTGIVLVASTIMTLIINTYGAHLFH